MSATGANNGTNYRNIALQLLSGVLRRGIAERPILQEAGISTELFDNADCHVSTHQFVRLLRATTQATNDEFFGLTRRAARPGFTTLMMDLVLGCTTLGAAIEQLEKFFSVASDDLLPGHTEVEGDILFKLELAHPEFDPDGFLVDFWLLTLHRLLSWVAGAMIPIKKVYSSSSETVSPQRLIYFIQGDWQTGHGIDGIRFSQKYMKAPIVRTRSEWHEHVQEMMHHGVLGWPNEGFGYANQIRAQLLTAIRKRQTIPRLNDVATSFCLTPQTLHRHLQEEGTSFQRILDELRRELASDMLLKQGLTIAQVAELLGFAEPRSFSRAFKQWTGFNPSALSAATKQTD